MKVIFGINKKYWRKKVLEGAHTLATRVGRALPPWARPLPRGPPVGPPVPIFCYMKSFIRRKNTSKLSGRELAYDFSSDERLHIAEDGHRRANRGPTRQGRAPTLVSRVWAPSGISSAQYFLLFPKITSVEFQNFWSCAE